MADDDADDDALPGLENPARHEAQRIGAAIGPAGREALREAPGGDMRSTAGSMPDPKVR